MKKFTPKFIGPFEIIGKVGKVAYKLALPQHMKIHPVFHISLLEQYIEDEFERGDDPPPAIEVDDHEEYEIERILDSNQERKKKFYLVKWTGYSDKFNSWVSEEDLGNAKELVDAFIIIETMIINLGGIVT